jgi:integrase
MYLCLLTFVHWSEIIIYASMASHMSSIYQKNGAFHLRAYSSVDLSTGQPLTVLGDNGKILRKQQSVRLARKDNVHTSENSTPVLLLANAKVAEIKRWEAASAAGDIVPTADMTISDFFERVFLPQMEKELTPATIETYKGYWNAYLKPHFNHTKTLKSYEAFTATNFLEKLATQYSRNTVTHCRAVASAIFAYAISKGFVVAAVGETKNPWRDARKNIKCQDVEKTVAYTQKDVERILDALEHVSGREEYSAKIAGMLVSTCFYGGLRPSEAAGLRWENVDLNNGTIHVCEAFVVGKFKKTTKTEEDRTVTMLPQLRNRFKLWALTWQHPTTGLVFPNKSGNNPVNINDISARIIGPTLEKAGLDWYGLYACRRGCGTELYNHGATIEDIAAFLGNSPAVAYKNYVKDKARSAARGAAKWSAALVEESDGRKFRDTPALTEVNP